MRIEEDFVDFSTFQGQCNSIWPSRSCSQHVVGWANRKETSLNNLIDHSITMRVADAPLLNFGSFFYFLFFCVCGGIRKGQLPPFQLHTGQPPSFFTIDIYSTYVDCEEYLSRPRIMGWIIQKGFPVLQFHPHPLSNVAFEYLHNIKHLTQK